MQILIQGRAYPWPDTPTYRQRRQAAVALGISVNELIDILLNPDRTAEREEVFAALALTAAGEDASTVLDLHPGDISIQLEPDDIPDEEDDLLPPASSPAVEGGAAAA